MIVCELMRRSRLSFKYALRQCKWQEETCRADAIARDLESKDAKSFWNMVSKLQNSKLPLPTKVNECHGENAIVKMWKSHYELIMNSVKADRHRQGVLHNISPVTDSDNITIMPDQILSAIKLAKRGKSPGQDGLASEHFIFADGKIRVLLSLVFSAMLSHGYLPADFMVSTVIPIIKNKTGNTSDKNNYRPVALVTPCSKILESVLLNIIDDYLLTHDNQFGFKDKHSTDMCIFALKSVIEYYKNHSSPVFTCFLDASKAFDRVNHWTLFKTLSDRNVPVFVLRF